MGWPVTFYILWKENVGGHKNWLSFFNLDAEEAILFVGSLLLLPIIPLCGVYVFFFSSQFLPVGYAFVVAFIGSLPMFIISFVMINIDLKSSNAFHEFFASVEFGASREFDVSIQPYPSSQRDAEVRF